MVEAQNLKPWSSLRKDEQLALRQAYQAELDKEPLTCSLDEKMARFTKWLAEQGVEFTMEDLRRPKKN